MGYFGWLGMVLFWGAFLWLIVWLINKNSESERKEQTPLEIAKERFAKGEITKKQYRDIMNEIST